MEPLELRAILNTEARRRPLADHELCMQAVLTENFDIKKKNDHLETMASQNTPDEAKIELLEFKLRRIAHLCDNCNNLGDAQAIAGGQRIPTKEYDCNECWVDRLQAQNARLTEELEHARQALKGMDE